jgi:hypothetical protein
MTSVMNQTRIFCLSYLSYLRRFDTIAFFSIIIFSFSYNCVFSAFLFAYEASIASFLWLISLCC